MDHLAHAWRRLLCTRYPRMGGEGGSPPGRESFRPGHSAAPCAARTIREIDRVGSRDTASDQSRTPLGPYTADSAQGVERAATVHLGLGLGLRREEVLGLRWSDVDEAVHVRRTLTAAEGRLHFGPPKSRAGERELPMPDFVARALQRHRIAQGERLLAIGIARSELVVDNGIGEPWQPATFSGAWRDFADDHGFVGLTFHGLRHGAATLLLAAGVPDAVAPRTTGHADTRILARYQDVVSELQQDAATRMDELLGGMGR